MEDDYFGLCPVCHKSNYILNVHASHYMVCHTHKLFWCLGSNLFSGWKEEPESEWRKNWELLQDYGEVAEPFFWPGNPFNHGEATPADNEESSF